MNLYIIHQVYLDESECNDLDGNSNLSLRFLVPCRYPPADKQPMYMAKPQLINMVLFQFCAVVQFFNTTSLILTGYQNKTCSVNKYRNYEL